MKFGSVCSGIEAASVAWHPLGWRASWLAEIEPFPSAVLAHHYPDVPNLGDMTQLPELIVMGHIEAPDVFCGGTPCQAFSVAGLRKSLDDARGNLSLTFCEIANAIDISRAHDNLDPCIVFWENVPGVLNTKDNAFGCFLAGLAGEDDPLIPPGGKWSNAGAVFGPQRAVAWRTLDAQYFGVAQRRRRVFVVASARNDFDPAAVLFEWDGLRRDTAPSRQAGQSIAPAVTAGAPNGGAAHGARSGSAKEGLIVPHVPELAACLTRGTGLRYDTDTDTILPVGVTVHGTDPSVQKVASYDDLAQCLRARTPGNIDNSSTTVVQQPVAFDTTQITSAGNYSNPQPGDPCRPLASGAHAPAIAQPIAFQSVDHAADATINLSPTMRAHDPMAVAVQASQSGVRFNDTVGTLDANYGSRRHNGVMQVRRLTPTECERLQGFPDNYTAIPWRTYQEAQRKGISYETLLAQRGMALRGPSTEECPDGPRYKALGNSWAVPVVRWIGWRIVAELHKGLA